MTQPQFIYRYQSAKRCNILNVRDNLLWVSNPSKFNDPFDCAEAMIHNRPREIKDDYFYDALVNFDDKQIMDIALLLRDLGGMDDDRESLSPSDAYFRQQLKSCCGVICFSELPKHLLMWSHYADSHKGFCLEFATNQLQLCNCLYRVVYRNSMPTIEPSEREYGDVRDLRELLLVKAKVWSYEKEWRVLSRKSNTNIEYPSDALTRVLVGAKASSRTVSLLKRALEGKNVPIVQLELSRNRFKLEESRIE